jgi:hypothetical protein
MSAVMDSVKATNARVRRKDGDRVNAYSVAQTPQGKAYFEQLGQIQWDVDEPKGPTMAQANNLDRLADALIANVK